MKCNLFALALLCLGATTPAQEREEGKFPPPAVYAGPVVVESLVGRVELMDGRAPEVRLEARLRNRGEQAESVQVGLVRSSAQTVNLGAGQSGSVTLVAASSHRGKRGGAQDVRIDLAPTIGGLPVGQPTGSVDIVVLLPEGTPALLRANTRLSSNSNGGRTTYQLVRKSFYPTQLEVAYSTGPVTLRIEKTINPPLVARAGPVRVTLVITNLGRDEARGVLLEDSFDPRDFIGHGSEFRDYRGKENDERLLWSHRLDAIPVGGSLTVTYDLEARNAVYSSKLDAVNATIAGELVGVSNEIFLERG